MKNTYSPIVLTTGGKRCCSTPATARPRRSQSKGERGTLNANLAAAGIDRNAIDVVVISHFHADHVNGLLMPDNSRRFPNAEIKVPEVEWKFWMDDGEMSRASKGRMTELFANNRRVFDTLGAQGHTLRLGQGGRARRHRGRHARPQHRAHVVSSCLPAARRSSCSRTSATTSRCSRRIRTGTASSTRTRRRPRPRGSGVYDMLVAEKLPVQGYHFPFPALARIEKQGSGYRVNPMPSL